MSHELFQERFISRAVPAWHNLGEVFDLHEQVDSEEAVSRIATGIEIQKVPLDVEVEGQKILTGKSAIVRMPSGEDPAEIFGIVSNSRYEVVQYEALGRTLKPLSDLYRVETAGILKGGRLMFIGLNAGSFDVRGEATERVDNYVVVVMSQQPNVAHKILHTPVRVVCRNTLSYGETQASLNLKIPHTPVSAEVLAFAGDVALNLDKKIAHTRAVFEAMALRPIAAEEFQMVLKAAYPDPAKPKNLVFLEKNGIDLSTLADRKDDKLFEKMTTAHDAWVYRVAREAKRREAATEMFERINDEHSAIAGSVYAAYQAVTEASDWRDGKGDADYSTLLGPRAAEKSRAFNLAKSLVSVSVN